MRKELEEFLQVYGLAVAPSTRERVRYQLGLFLRRLESFGIHCPIEITPEYVLRWLSEIRETVKPITYPNYAIAVKRFLEYLEEKGYYLVSPWPRDLSLPKQRSVPKRIPGFQETLTLLDKGASFRQMHWRNRALLELAYGSGLRKGELRGLNVTDVRIDWLRVRGKGRVERLVPMGKRARACLKRYLEAERPLLATRAQGDEPALFLSRLGNRLAPHTLTLLFQKIRPEGSGLGFHSLRHACATHMLQNGASTRVIQKLLGHRRLSTTQIYTRVDTGDLARVLARHHPRG